MIEGFFDENGSMRFRKRHELESDIPTEHFRLFEKLNFTSMGIGTYLGNPDSQTDNLVTAAIKESVSSGAINVIDTAINYRNQMAERSVGRAITELVDQGEISRNEVFISTKIGYLAPDAGSKLDFKTYVENEFLKPEIIRINEIAGGIHCISPKYIEDQIERSRRNLGLQKIDLLYLHNIGESQIAEVGKDVFHQRIVDAVSKLEEQRRRGHINHYGLATWSSFRVGPNNSEYLNLQDIVEIAKREGGESNGFRFIQLPFNLAMPEAVSQKNQIVDDQGCNIIDAASKLRIGVFTSAPLLQGKLVNHPQIPKAPNLNTQTQTCIQFARSTPGILAPLVGHKRHENVKENLTVARTPPLDQQGYLELFSA